MAPTKHTPGPWYRDGEHILFQSAIIRDSTGFEVANTRHFIIDVHEANANLVTASPDMFDALLDAIKLIDHLGGNPKYQQIAINKALGI
jgi:hypothetical protein